ncbi:MAG: C40 family peptidase [Bacteroidetes bacterium]|nr:C40 family peptidase [Bacteroidota bacterium]
MEKGFCNIAMIPVRREPSHKSELVTQLLFGEPYHVDLQQGEWLLIRGGFDDYPGWMDAGQHEPVSEEGFNSLIKSEWVVSQHHSIIKDTMTGLDFEVYPGSTIPEANFKIGNRVYSFEGKALQKSEVLHPREIILRMAGSYINSPYLWGGRTPCGIDCSGLVQVLFKIAGINLPRDAFMQAKLGEDIHFISDAVPGDLLFFDNNEGEIVHTGILYKPDLILHASGRVRIDKADHHGIFSLTTGKYTHKLRTIKKILS